MRVIGNSIKLDMNRVLSFVFELTFISQKNVFDKSLRSCHTNICDSFINNIYINRFAFFKYYWTTADRLKNHPMVKLSHIVVCKTWSAGEIDEGG